MKTIYFVIINMNHASLLNPTLPQTLTHKKDNLLKAYVFTHNKPHYVGT